MADLNIEGRLSTVEAGLARQHEDMITLSKRMATGFESINSKLDGFSKERLESRKFPWPAISGMLAIGILALGPVTWLSSANYESLKIANNKYVDHISDGHPDRVNDKTKTNARNLKELDVTLQREMRLLQTNDLEVIRGLDSKLQSEMKLMIDGLDAKHGERIKALERALYQVH